jgi:hypothetical protein
VPQIRPLRVSVAGRPAAVASAAPAVGSENSYLYPKMSQNQKFDSAVSQRQAWRQDRVRPRLDRLGRTMPGAGL